MKHFRKYDTLPSIRVEQGLWDYVDTESGKAGMTKQEFILMLIIKGKRMYEGEKNVNNFERELSK